MKISSPVFQNNGTIPPKYTCDGENINPPLYISEIPQGAKTLALIVDDPDAPRGIFVHWVIWNISVNIGKTGENSIKINENSVPIGTSEGITDFGRKGYGGPCPPSGIHRYFFKLYALDTELSLSSSTKKADLEKAMDSHILAKAEIMGNYKRI